MTSQIHAARGGAYHQIRHCVKPKIRAGRAFPSLRGVGLAAPLLFLKKGLAVLRLAVTISHMWAMSESGCPPHFTPPPNCCLALPPARRHHTKRSTTATSRLHALLRQT